MKDTGFRYIFTTEEMKYDRRTNDLTIRHRRVWDNGGSGMTENQAEVFKRKIYNHNLKTERQIEIVKVFVAYVGK